MLFAVTGFLAGLTHVLAGPDHLAAVAPYAVHQRARGWIVGLRWGVGHAAGVVLVGLLALVLRNALPLELVSSWSERLVGVVLVAIGIWALRLAFRSRLHAHEHVHDGQVHVHVHLHAADEDHGEQEGHGKSHVHSHTALGIGMLHGLAGSSHLLGVLPALALPSAGAAAGYLVAFGIGSVLGMCLFSSLVGLIAGRFALAGMAAHRGLLCGSAAAAIVVGGIWLTSAG